MNQSKRFNGSEWVWTLDTTNQRCRYTREVTKTRSDSPILFDPILKIKRISDEMKSQEVESLRRSGVLVSDANRPLRRGTVATIYAAELESKPIVVKRSYTLRQSWAELEALQLFGSQKTHKNIIRFYGHKVRSNKMYFYIEFGALGDLADYLTAESRNRDLCESEMRHILKQLVSGLDHMHSNGYAHRDLKCENIVLFGSNCGSDSIVCKLCDFGSTRGDLRLANGSIRLSKTVIGTPALMAPEVSDRPYNAFISDVYSLGVILYQLSHKGLFPFHLGQEINKDQTQRVQQLAALKRLAASLRIWDTVSNPLKQLLTKMLESNPDIRITLKDVLSTEWVLRTKCEDKRTTF